MKPLPLHSWDELERQVHEAFHWGNPPLHYARSLAAAHVLLTMLTAHGYSIQSRTAADSDVTTVRVFEPQRPDGARLFATCEANSAAAALCIAALSLHRMQQERDAGHVPDGPWEATKGTYTLPLE